MVGGRSEVPLYYSYPKSTLSSSSASHTEQGDAVISKGPHPEQGLLTVMLTQDEYMSWLLPALNGGGGREEGREGNWHISSSPLPPAHTIYSFPHPTIL